jgi:deazaflavin-dependent oxidoreductase (nitroreductase family)
LSTDQARGGRSSVPPRWVYRALWTLHRAGYALSGGRLGLRAADGDRPGTLRLRTTGRRSGQERATMLTYLASGEGFAVVASNAGADTPPAWWLNLQAQPRAQVDLPGQTIGVEAREATAAERASLWSRFVEQQGLYERYAASTERHIPIVILVPGGREAHA